MAAKVRQAVEAAKELMDQAQLPASVVMPQVEAALAGPEASISYAAIQKELKEPLRRLFLRASKDNAAHLKVDLDWDTVNELAVQYAEERAAELVGKKLVDGQLVDNPGWAIDESTRDMIRRYVKSELENAGTPAEIERGIREHYAFSENRAETIARTETGFAYNHGSVEGTRQAGLQYVDVYDGDYDAACAAADGQVWTLEHAEANPLQHPNCVRAFSPHVGPAPSEEE